MQNIKIKYIFVKEYKNKINNSDKKMSRSRNKYPCLMFTQGCKSRKAGKKQCHKKFRTAVRCGKEVFRMQEVMNTWDLGGDGKRILTFDRESETFKIGVRK